MKIKRSLKIFLLAALVFLPSCTPLEWFKKKFGSGGESEVTVEIKPGVPVKRVPVGTAIATVDGKPVVTVEEFENAFDMLKKAQPMMAEMLSMLPENQQRDIFSQLVNNLLASIVVEDHVKSKGWDKNPDYIRDLKKFHRDLDRELANRELQKKVLEGISINRKEAEKYYDKNRDANMFFKRPPFMISPDGIKARAIIFDSESKAKTALEQLNKGNNIKKVAKEHKESVRDLGIVSVQSSELDRIVLVRILGIKEFPSFEIIQSGDGQHWIIEAVEKRDAEFAPFKNVEKEVMEFVKNDRFVKNWNNKVKDLVKKRNVTINEDVIEHYVVKRAPAKNRSVPPAQGDK